MKIAVVRNQSRDGVINRLGQTCPEVYGKETIKRTADALRLAGYSTEVLEGDKSLLANLEAFMPPQGDGRAGGLVFNMAYGIQGGSRYTHVPAMLEMAGVPYTGAGPLGHAISLDKIVTKIQMQSAGIPTPKYCAMGTAESSPDGLRFPLIVKPRHESTSYGLRVVTKPGELQEAVLAVVTRYQQEALVEEFVEGREIAVALLGNDPVQVLPLVEYDFGNRPLKVVAWEDKNHKQPDPPRKVCPAPLDEGLAERLRTLALATFRACHCRDYARVDIRLDAGGNPFVLEINSMASLGSGSSYVMAAQTAGYAFPTLIRRIVDVAHERYFGTPAPGSEGRG